MNRKKRIQQNKIRRQKRVRKNMIGTAVKPRLSVHRTNQHIFAQLIDDINQVTILSSNDASYKTGTKTEKAQKVGIKIAKACMKKKIEAIVFDRGRNKYHGRVKALAEAARTEGLNF